MTTTNLEGAILFLSKLKSEAAPVLAWFVGLNGGLQFKMNGFVALVEQGRVAVSSRKPDAEPDQLPETELAFEINGECQFDYTETKDYPDELKKPSRAQVEVLTELGNEAALQNWPGFTSSLNIFMPGKGRVALLELRGSSL